MTKANLLIAVVSDQLEERAVAIIREEGGGGVTILPARGLNFPEHKSFSGSATEGSRRYCCVCWMLAAPSMPSSV